MEFNFNISSRGKGNISNNKFEDYEIISYDLVSSPGVNFDELNNMYKRLQDLVKRKQLRDGRKEKLNNIWKNQKDN
jgi:hypothetical protein